MHFPNSIGDASIMRKSYDRRSGSKEDVDPVDPSEDPSRTNPTIYVTNPIMNLISCVELLGLCCEGKSDLAEEKCQTEVMTLENSFNIIKACDYFWPLKKCFLDYVWQCFLDSNSKKIFVE